MQAMTIKPILFSTEMVRSILEGRKTVTRRVMKPQPAGRPERMREGSCWPGYFASVDDERVYRPPYHPGDILWVRETWQAVYETEWSEDKPYTGRNIRELIPNFDSIQKVEAGISQECSSTAMKPRMKYFVFKASDIKYANNKNRLVWRPSIHMPKAAARIFLRVTAVRVERLREMVLADVLMEGIQEQRAYEDTWDLWHQTWDSTIKPADRTTYGWKENPWVWVINFERAKEIRL